VTLYILRHGIAEEAEPGGTDRDRHLTSRLRMRRAGRGLRVLVPRLDALYTSPYPRAAETAALVAAARGDRLKPRELEALVPQSSALDIVRALRGLRGEQVMLVGHEPSLSGLASLLLTGSTDGMRVALKKGGCIAVALRAPAPRAATLEWIMTPRALRRIGASAGGDPVARG
jgi:phosphohistidine phosphatase